MQHAGRGPGVPRVYGVCLGKRTGLVMEQARGVALDKAIAKWAFSRAADKRVLLNLLRVMQRLNQAGVRHGDISEDNLMLTKDPSVHADWDVLVIDFGMAEVCTPGDCFNSKQFLSVARGLRGSGDGSFVRELFKSFEGDREGLHNPQKLLAAIQKIPAGTLQLLTKAADEEGSYFG